MNTEETAKTNEILEKAGVKDNRQRLLFFARAKTICARRSVKTHGVTEIIFTPEASEVTIVFGNGGTITFTAESSKGEGLIHDDWHELPFDQNQDLLPCFQELAAEQEARVSAILHEKP